MQRDSRAIAEIVRHIFDRTNTDTERRETLQNVMNFVEENAIAKPLKSSRLP
ncbi:hypothetical protein [Baaleninema simplex]|uniref:hypothetical protein n=1 Tax=Baaleninema simplex TaxID=2862350 RepID=UPI00034AE92A|nr:hypothetical protein [Baaleninema simplex]